MPSRRPHLVAALLIAAFIGFGFTGLGRLPKVYEDEALIAAPGYSLLTTGTFGTSMDAGFYGTEKHTYGLMPLSPILVGASLRLFGLGLLQARLVPLLTVAGVLALTYLVASRFLTAGHGVVAVALLAVAPVQAPITHLPTGIPLFDMARIVRYDIAVPLFGLTALLVLVPVLRGQREPSPARLFLAGSLTGLATLSHLYGIFWLPALLLPLFVSYGRRALLPSLWAAGGLLVALLPWLVFVASGWSDYVGQNLHDSDRFRLLDAGFYAENLRTEISRYGLLLKAGASAVSPWLLLVSVAAGVAALVRRGPRALLAILATLTLGIALLLELKNVLYLATVWPLLALVAAAGLFTLWQMLPRTGRALLMLAGVMSILEGAADTVRSWLSRRGRLVATLDDASYGRFRVYAVRTFRTGTGTVPQPPSADGRLSGGLALLSELRMRLFSVFPPAGREAS